jgi:hypothetical protein
MNIDEFIATNRCEHLYHMSEKGSWPNIQRLGLLSTSALLDLCGVTGSERFTIESELRISRVPIKHPVYGDIYIRDQDPMRDRPSDGIILAKLLEAGTSVRMWLEFLNGKTFFWVPEYELTKMLCARLYRNKPHWVITVDTRALLGRYADEASISDQNSGSLYSKKLRGINTFVPFLKSPKRSNIIELAIDRGVPDITDYTVSVVECVGTYLGSYPNGERVCKNVKQIWP